MKAFENRANELYINLRLHYEKNQLFSGKNKTFLNSQQTSHAGDMLRFKPKCRVLLSHRKRNFITFKSDYKTFKFDYVDKLIISTISYFENQICVLLLKTISYVAFLFGFED